MRLTIVICWASMLVGATNCSQQITADLIRTNITVKYAPDFSEQEVQFSIWFGKSIPSQLFVGFTNNGDLKNMDGILYDARKLKIEDVSVDKNFQIQRDMQQDLKVLDITPVNFSLKRKLVTCDPRDYAIEVGTTQFLIAGSWSSQKLKKIDDERWIMDKKFGKIIEASKEAEETDRFKLKTLGQDVQRVVVNSLTPNPVPNIETTYQCIIKKMPFNTVETKFHIIRMEPYITPGNEHLVHHMEVFLCQDDVTEWTGNCNDPKKPKKSKSCSHVIAAWAMGEGPIYYPEEAGLPLGGRGKHEFVMVEIHYNNPELLSGVHDRSGFQFFVTPRLRPYDAGIIELGLIYSDANSIPPGQKSWSMNGYCPSQCTQYLPEDGINVFASQLHAHLTGRKIWTSHYRNVIQIFVGVKIGEINRDEHYSPHWQHLQSVRPYVKIMPSDHLVTTCVFETSSRPNMTFGGYGIQDEMCVNYVYYFPASDIEVCKSAISNSTLREYFARRYQQKNPETPISELYNSITEWSPARSEELYSTLSSGNINMNCLKGDGEQHRFISNDRRQSWGNMAKPKLFTGPFIEKRDQFECPAINDLF